MDLQTLVVKLVDRVHGVVAGLYNTVRYRLETAGPGQVGLRRPTRRCNPICIANTDVTVECAPVMWVVRYQGDGD